MFRLRIIPLVLIILVLNTFTVSADEFMVNPFYAISSYNEYSNINQDLNGNVNHMYFQWGRLAMNDDGIVQYTNIRNTKISQYDDYIEFGYPGADAMNDYKTRYPSGKAFLSVFFSSKTYTDGKNSETEFLNMHEAAWEQHIVAPMLQMLDETNTERNFAFDGVVLDFEGFRSVDTYKYINFLNYLNSRLGDKLLAVCVSPSNVAGYYAGYDYKGISDIADYVILMAYDYQHGTKYPESHPMSGKIMLNDIPESQSYPNVKSAVEALVNTYKADSQKIILGMDLTAVAWVKLQKTIDSQSYVYYDVRRPYLEDVLKMNVAAQYDVNSKVNKKYLDKATALALFNDVYSKYGDELISVEYYFESPISLYDKYHSILQENDLAGVSVWRLGIGGSDIWESLISILNKPIDLNKDSKLDIDDLVIYSLSSGSNSLNTDGRWADRADIDRDGNVNEFDFNILKGHYK